MRDVVDGCVDVRELGVGVESKQGHDVGAVCKHGDLGVLLQVETYVQVANDALDEVDDVAEIFVADTG